MMPISCLIAAMQAFCILVLIATAIFCVWIATLPDP
jgi:hypothetical protein